MTKKLRQKFKYIENGIRFIAEAKNIFFIPCKGFNLKSKMSKHEKPKQKDENLVLTKE